MERKLPSAENNSPDLIFFKKKPLTERTEQELENFRSDLESERARMVDLWQATVGVARGNNDSNHTLNKSMLLGQDEKSDTKTAEGTDGKEDTDGKEGTDGKEDTDGKEGTDEKEDTASAVEFGPETCEQAAEFYKKCIQEFKKNASIQREAVRDLVEKYFDFLHCLDDEEPLLEKETFEDGLAIKFIFYVSIFLPFAAFVLFILRDNDLLKCSDDLFACLHRIVFGLAFKIRNFYLKFHGITPDYSYVPNVCYVSEVTDDGFGSSKRTEIIC